MGIRRQAGQERSWPAIHWQTPSLVIAIITLVTVTGAVLSDAPRWPFKAVPSNSQSSNAITFGPRPPDATPWPATASSPPPGRWMMQKSAVSAMHVDSSHAYVIPFHEDGNAVLVV